MALDADLDHVAVAAEHVALVWPRYAGDLGGTWKGGGGSPGFYSAQVAYADGMKVEALHPERTDESDFLRRFLDQHGPGPHHLTFKVPDLAAAIDQVRSAGITPVGIDTSDPGWMEAFLHPRAAQGIVVQLAQAAGEWEAEDQPADFPAPRVARPATLLRVVHAVADLDAGRRLFADLLGGMIVADGSTGDGRYLDLRWPGPGRVRLVEPAAGSALAAWTGDRPGRLHHLAFSVDRPGEVPDSVAVDDGWWEVTPEANLGVRLRLTSA